MDKVISRKGVMETGCRDKVKCRKLEMYRQGQVQEVGDVQTRSNTMEPDYRN